MSEFHNTKRTRKNDLELAYKEMSNAWDDVWGSDSDAEIEQSPDLVKLRDEHSKRGYLDGIVMFQRRKSAARFQWRVSYWCSIGEASGQWL